MKRATLSFVLLSLILYSCFSQKKAAIQEPEKPILAVYSGGHHWDISMTLYKDSTFLYKIVRDMMALTTKTKGTYTKTDTSLTLYGKRSLGRRLPVQTFRIQGDSLLMYTEQQEAKDDDGFMRAYYTLTRDK